MIVSYHISLNVTADMELFSANGREAEILFAVDKI